MIDDSANLGRWKNAQELVDNGNVQVEWVDDERGIINVESGDSTYVVGIDMDGDCIAKCSCPHEQFGGKHCKHAIASYIALSREASKVVKPEKVSNSFRLRKLVKSLKGDCDHPLEDYEEIGFRDMCPECGNSIDARIHSIALAIKEIMGDTE